MLRRPTVRQLLVLSKADGKDGLPLTAQIRLNSTMLLAKVRGVDWENSWIRRGVLESAQEIAAAVSQEPPSAEPLPAQRP
jgi:hypothetical protein